jgi:hypothetical protein
MRDSGRFARLKALVLLVLGALLISACTDQPPNSPTGPSFQPSFNRATAQDIRAAIAAQEHHTAALMHIPGVVGTAVGFLPSGAAAVKIFLAQPNVGGLPSVLDDIPTVVEVTGQFVAFSTPTLRARPAPLGYSVGHPDITAGTIGARVINSSGNLFVLSNNHVLANSNDASLGDPTLQPGPYDGGTSADQIGTLSAFKPIDFSSSGSNTIDAAIAASDALNVGSATPTDDGYGQPSSAIFGDANSDGTFDDKTALLNVNVEKFGRTTKLTHGRITGINGTVSICYEVVFIFCTKSANFVDQLIIEPGTFSGGGDSGSLIVSDDSNKQPVALLFAGSSTQTIANRIDLVLGYFGVRIDDGLSAPPTPLTDVATTSVTAPASVTVGDVVNVSVTVQNVGNQPVGSSFDVVLKDSTANVVIGTQSVAGLAVGASATRTFSWNTTGASPGAHFLIGRHTLSDDVSTNNGKATSSTVNTASSAIHVGDLDGSSSNGGGTWSATVEITVHDASHNPLNGATVVGNWSPSGLNSNTCTTGDLGGNGTCIVLFPSLKKGTKTAAFTVTSVTMSGKTYSQASNHDVDGSSNGTTVQVKRP